MTNLGSLGVLNSLGVNPVLGLLVVLVIDLGLGVDRGCEVVKQCTVAAGLAVDLDLEALVGLYDQSVKGRGLDDAGHRWVLEVLLLILPSLGVLVLEDEVNLLLLALISD